MKYQLSVVLPIYNVSKYLGECLASIVKKQEEKVEILLIDDGSTDESGILADQFQAEYKNVKCYHKPNGGLADARNFGLLNARGKYVFFLDSDDFVIDSAIDLLISTIAEDDLDVLLWDAGLYNEEGLSYEKTPAYYRHSGVSEGLIYTGSDIIKAQLDCKNDYVTTVWSGLYRRDFLISNSLFFEKGLLHEDEMWTPKVLLSASKVKYVQKTLYCYRIRSNSIMRQLGHDHSEHLECLVYIYSSLFVYYDWKIADEGFRAKLKGTVVKRYLHKIAQYKMSSYPLISKRINRTQLFVYAATFKDKLRALLLLCNVQLYCQVSKLFGMK